MCLFYLRRLLFEPFEILIVFIRLQRYSRVNVPWVSIFLQLTSLLHFLNNYIKTYINILIINVLNKNCFVSAFNWLFITIESVQLHYMNNPLESALI